MHSLGWTRGALSYIYGSTDTGHICENEALLSFAGKTSAQAVLVEHEAVAAHVAAAAVLTETMSVRQRCPSGREHLSPEHT